MIMSEGKIYEAISNVMKDVGAVGKNKVNQMQRYNFRGIDDVMNALNPAMIKNHVFVAPTVLEEKREERETATGALPLWVKETGWPACMVGPVYDDLTKWRKDYSEELFESQFEKICIGWRKGLGLLDAAFEGKELSEDDKLLIDCARVSSYHFESSLNHIKFIRNRHNREMMLSIIDREEELALAEVAAVGKNPTIGYESSNHYFFTRTDLVEKVISCRHLRERLLSERDF